MNISATTSISPAPAFVQPNPTTSQLEVELRFVDSDIRSQESWKQTYIDQVNRSRATLEKNRSAAWPPPAWVIEMDERSLAKAESDLQEACEMLERLLEKKKTLQAQLDMKKADLQPSQSTTQQSGIGLDRDQHKVTESSRKQELDELAKNGIFGPGGVLDYAGPMQNPGADGIVIQEKLERSDIAAAIRSRSEKSAREEEEIKRQREPYEQELLAEGYSRIDARRLAREKFGEGYWERLYRLTREQSLRIEDCFTLMNQGYTEEEASAITMQREREGYYTLLDDQEQASAGQASATEATLSAQWPTIMTRHAVL